MMEGAMRVVRLGDFYRSFASDSISATTVSGPIFKLETHVEDSSRTIVTRKDLQFVAA